MSERTKERIRAARVAADWLAGHGHPMMAESVRALCRSHATMSATMSALHRDNMALRAWTKNG